MNPDTLPQPQRIAYWQGFYAALSLYLSRFIAIFVSWFYLAPGQATTSCIATSKADGSHEWHVGDELCQNLQVRMADEDGTCAGCKSEWTPLLRKEEQHKVSYTAWTRPMNGRTEYKTITIIPNATAEEILDFNLDENFRKRWEKFLLHVHLLEQGPQPTGVTERQQVVRYVRHFPMGMITDREYVVARRVLRIGDDWFGFCKNVDHPQAAVIAAATRTAGVVRVQNLQSCFRCRTVPDPWGSDEPACEMLMLHTEDIRVNERMARMAVKMGMLGFVKEMTAAAALFIKERRARGLHPHEEDPQAYSFRGPDGEIPMNASAGGGDGRPVEKHGPFGVLRNIFKRKDAGSNATGEKETSAHSGSGRPSMDLGLLGKGSFVARSMMSVSTFADNWIMHDPLVHTRPSVDPVAEPPSTKRDEINAAATIALSSLDSAKESSLKAQLKGLKPGGSGDGAKDSKGNAGSGDRDAALKARCKRTASDDSAKEPSLEGGSSLKSNTSSRWSLLGSLFSSSLNGSGRLLQSDVDAASSATISSETSSPKSSLSESLKANKKGGMMAVPKGSEADRVLGVIPASASSSLSASIASASNSRSPSSLSAASGISKNGGVAKTPFASLGRLVSHDLGTAEGVEDEDVVQVGHARVPRVRHQEPIAKRLGHAALVFTISLAAATALQFKPR